ncbi:BRO-N domain-containing protein [Streptococcus hongkongensis]|nr:antirepressor [Streptococcus uberis]
MKVEYWNGYDIRFVEHKGEWWAVLADICHALDLKPKRVKERLVDEVVSTDHIPDKLGRNQEMLIVNEFGIYDTIFSSRKPEAKSFKFWVFETIKQLRQATGLEGFEVFRMLDKEHQKEAMARLTNSLGMVSKKDLIKANTITNKAVSNKFGYSKMVKKSEMTPDMLVARETILDDTVELMGIKEKFGLNISVSESIYNKN